VLLARPKGAALWVPQLLWPRPVASQQLALWVLDTPGPRRDRVRGACFFAGWSCAGLTGLEARFSGLETRFSGLLAPGWSSMSIAMEPRARPPREKDAYRAPTAAGHVGATKIRTHLSMAACCV
jgi:hypothetical protein